MGGTHGLTLERKLEAVQRTTVASRSPIPRVCRAIPPKEMPLLFLGVKSFPSAIDIEYDLCIGFELLAEWLDTTVSAATS